MTIIIMWGQQSSFRSGVLPCQRLLNHQALLLLLLVLLSFCRSSAAVVDYGRCVMQLILYDTNLDFGVDKQEFANLVRSWGECVDTSRTRDADAAISATFEELACVCPDNVSFNTCCNDENDDDAAVLARPASRTDPYAVLVCDAIDALAQQTCEQPESNEEDNDDSDSDNEEAQGDEREENVSERPIEEAPMAAPASSTAVSSGNDGDGEGGDENTEGETADAGDTEDQASVDEGAGNDDNSNVVVPILQDRDRDPSATDRDGDESDSSGTTPTWIWFIIGLVFFCGVALWVVLFAVAYRQRRQRRSQFVEHVHPLEEDCTDRPDRDKDGQNSPPDNTEDVCSSLSSESGQSSSPHITTTLQKFSSSSFSQHAKQTENGGDSALSAIPNEENKVGILIPALDPATTTTTTTTHHNAHDRREMVYYVDETSDEEDQGDHHQQHDDGAEDEFAGGQTSLSTWLRDWLSVSSPSESEASASVTSSTDDQQSYSSSSFYRSTDATNDTPIVSNTTASHPHLSTVLSRDCLRPPRRQRSSNINSSNISNTGFNYDSPPSDDDDVLTGDDTKFHIAHLAV